MKKIKIALILISALSLLSLVVFLGINRILPKKLETKTYSSETSVAGVVEIEAVPKQLNVGREMVFTVSLNNHSIDLSYDFTKIALVVDDEGKIYRPVRWTGGSGGHHLSGDLIFDKLDKRVSRVGLNITGVDNQNVNFDWKI